MGRGSRSHQMGQGIQAARVPNREALSDLSLVISHGPLPALSPAPRSGQILLERRSDPSRRPFHHFMKSSWTGVDEERGLSRALRGIRALTRFGLPSSIPAGPSTPRWRILPLPPGEEDDVVAREKPDLVPAHFHFHHWSTGSRNPAPIP